MSNNKMQYNVCKTCGASNGRAGMLINDECLNCHDTRKNKTATFHSDLNRTDIELKKTFEILKSSEPTIDQMNEVIALFVNGSSIKEHGSKRYVYYQNSCAKDVSDLKYHTSWDWLMPVWNKLRTTVQLDNDGDYPAEFCSMSDVWENACFEPNILNAHYLVHDAIQWYNQQKQNNGTTEQ